MREEDDGVQSVMKSDAHAVTAGVIFDAGEIPPDQSFNSVRHRGGEMLGGMSSATVTRRLKPRQSQGVIRRAFSEHDGVITPPPVDEPAIAVRMSVAALRVIFSRYFCACYLWPWLICPPLAALRYVMHFRFLGMTSYECFNKRKTLSHNGQE